jgi:hypothetical protein
VATKEASLVGLVLGPVFIVTGFTYGNSGQWLLGIILLSLGIWMRFKKSGSEE